MHELVAIFLQGFRNHALAGQQHFVSHFAEQGVQCERGSREKLRPVHSVRQDLSELQIRDRLRCYDVHGAGNCFVLHDESKDAHYILERDPRHPLSTGA